MKYFIIIISLIFTSLARESNAQNFVTPEVLTNLSETVNETSGLANLNGEIWTHNDSGDDALLYQINPDNGNITRIVEIMNAINEDWEDITHDDDFVYIGDVGNNYGDRTDLKIYKVSRAAIEGSDEVFAELIHYYYSDQTSWEPNHNDNNFDCEALCSFGDHLYLFSKNWVDNQTRCYQLSKQAGFHVAEYQSTFDIECMVTGAEMQESQNRLLLIGYNSSGGSYTWYFDNFIESDFFSGTSTKLIWTSLTQIEGICVANEPAGIYISSEEINGYLDPTLFYQDLPLDTTEIPELKLRNYKVYTNHGSLIIEPGTGESITAEIQLLNTSGNILFKNKYVNELQVQLPTRVPIGIYLLVVITDSGISTFKVKL